MPAVWRLIPAGTFQMGSPTTESCRGFSEVPHEVTLTRPFEIQSTEVTQAQFESLMRYNSSRFSPGGPYAACGDNCPMEWMTWYEAAAYCNALSIKDGFVTCYDCTGSDENVTCETKSAYAGDAIYDCAGYRLPTEAEWEYAYRAGTTTAYYSGTNDAAVCNDRWMLDANLDRIGWYYANSDDATHIVATKLPNAWGLYDMAGNVREWCHDWYSAYPTAAVTDPGGPATGSGRISRGGDWDDPPVRARAAYRGSLSPHYRDISGGFRCARTR